MFPAQDGKPQTDIRKDVMAKLLKNEEVSKLGKKVFGLEPQKQPGLISQIGSFLF